MLSNEFALNARMHPMAAIWANAVFNDSLKRVAKQRKVWFDLTDIINTTGMTERLDYSSNMIDPSFFRFTAAWQKRMLKRELEEEMLRHESALNQYQFCSCTDSPLLSLSMGG